MTVLPHQLLARRIAQRIDRHFDTNVRARYFKGLKFAEPAGDPGWFGPGSAVWHVHSHMPAVAFGLACAAYIEQLDPSIYWMGVHHSRLVAKDADGNPTGGLDPEGAAVRFGHSLSFFLGTAYGSTETAERLARTVRAMHHTVKGTRPDGLPYDADDPDWLRWNYATVVWGIATAHERYHPHPLPDIDDYYREFVRVGHALGGTGLPATKADTLACLRAYLPRLALTPGKADTTGPNARRGDNPLAGPFMDWAVRDMLPDWAARLVMYQRPNPVELHARRAFLRLNIVAPHAITGPLREFREAEARVAGGAAEPVAPAYEPGSDPVRTREDAEAMA